MHNLGIEIKVVVILLCIGFYPAGIVAQQTVDQRHETLLEKENADPEEIDQMIEFIQELIRNNDENVTQYLDEVLEIAANNHYYDGIYSYLHELHRYLSDNRQYDTAKEQIEKIFGENRSHFDAEQIIGIELLLANLMHSSGDSEQAYLLFEDLYNQSTSEENRAYIYINRGAIYRNQGQYDYSIESYLAALNHYNNSDNSYLQMDVNNRLGVTYYDIEDYETSIRFYRAAQDLARSLDNEIELLRINSNLATSYRRAGEYELALEYIEESLKIAKKLDLPSIKAQNLLNMANIYSNNLQEFEKGHEYYQQSLDISRELDLTYGIVLNHMGIGRTYHRQGNYQQTLVSYDSARTYADIIELGHVIRLLNEQTSDAHAALGNFEEALDYHLKYHELILEQFGEDRERAIADMQTKYETDLKIQELEHSQEMAAEQRAQIMYLNATLVLLVLGGVGMILFMNHRNRTMKELYRRNKELLHSFNKIKQQEEKLDESSDPLFQLFKSITELFEKEEMYTEPDLSIKKLADLLSSNEKYISQAVSSYSDMNFNNFLNVYRINKARTILSDTENSYRINEVMYECGYNSSSTFYTAFKKYTGMTPKQFSAMAARDRQSKSMA